MDIEGQDLRLRQTIELELGAARRHEPVASECSTNSLGVSP